MSRFALKKVNGREIQTANFFNRQYANVSAVMQGHQKMFQETLVLSTIHNPLAQNPLPTGLFGTYKEFVAEERGDEYEIKDVAMKP
jgi:type I restriction enzyme S subunit